MQLSENTKKILYTILLIAVTVAIGYLLYIVFIYTPGTSINTNVNGNRNGVLPNTNDLLNVNGLVNGNTNAGTNTNQGGLPIVSPTANGGKTETTILTPNIATQKPAPAQDGSIRYYNSSDGKFYRVDAKGTVTSLADAQFRGAQNVVWAHTNNQVIMQFPDGSNIFYDLNTKKQVTLPKEFQEMDFAPNDNKIAFLYMHTDPERRVLAVSSPDGSSAKTLESVGDNAHHVMVDWSPTGKVAATYYEFTDTNRQTLGFIGLNGENFKGAVVEGRGLRSQYTPNGQQMLYSTYTQESGYKPGLWVIDADGDNIGKNRKQIQLNTFADKCTISSDSTTAYCAVPTEQKYGYGLDERLLEGVPDELYSVDLRTGLSSKIALPVDQKGNAVYSIHNLSVTDDQKTLFFRDLSTGQLAKISLK